jgi:hypothetical protein
MLETSVGSGFLLSDSMTIGDLADQKQQRNRTVVIDVAVCRNIHSNYRFDVVSLG